VAALSPLPGGDRGQACKLQAPASFTRAGGDGGAQPGQSHFAGLPPLVIELLFTEGNHVCAVCVANGHCGASRTAPWTVGMDISRLALRASLIAAVGISPTSALGLDHNRLHLLHAVRAGSATRWRAPTSGRGLAGKSLPDRSPGSDQPGERWNACTELRQVR